MKKLPSMFTEIKDNVPIPDFNLPPVPDAIKLAGTGSKIRGTGELTKYEREYDLFCRWAATPPELRTPKTALDFEKKYKINKGYTDDFKKRVDYKEKYMNYLYEWMMEVYPEIVHAIYRRSIGKSSRDAALFAEIISKREDLSKPKVQVSPLIMVGVSQERIDKLFTPKSHEAAIDGEIK